MTLVKVAKFFTDTSEINFSPAGLVTNKVKTEASYSSIAHLFPSPFTYLQLYSKSIIKIYDINLTPLPHYFHNDIFDTLDQNQKFSKQTFFYFWNFFFYSIACKWMYSNIEMHRSAVKRNTYIYFDVEYIIR